MNVNISSLIKACNDLRLEYSQIDNHGDFFQVKIKNKLFFFHDVVTPLNSEIVSKIALDKEFTYQLLNQSINMPKTMGYLDPEVKREKLNYVKFKNIHEIVSDINKYFEFPVIIKRNSGRAGNNVFLVNNDSEIEESLNIIFSKNTKKYDYIALAQEKINIQKEYRVIVLDGNIQLIYLKDNSNGKFAGNISPLHYENANAVLILDDGIKTKLQKFIEPIFDRLDFKYGGLDIAVDESGKLWLIEINTKPGFEYFAKDNGAEAIVDLYKNILRSLDGRINE
jgi:glutathione synthase/RimK-type ligase-like ATP-grasp enzyme